MEKKENITIPEADSWKFYSCFAMAQGLCILYFDQRIILNIKQRFVFIVCRFYFGCCCCFSWLDSLANHFFPGHFFEDLKQSTISHQLLNFELWNQIEITTHLPLLLLLGNNFSNFRFEKSYLVFISWKINIVAWFLVNFINQTDIYFCERHTSTNTNSQNPASAHQICHFNYLILI